jgi:hypothetical protein
MSFAESDWPKLMQCGFWVGHAKPDGSCTSGVDTLSNLGKALALVGALATAGLAGVQAGIDMGMELVAEQMRQDAMRQSMKGQPNILVPSRQLILPGIK